jgi:hypothetical protein
LDEIPKRELRGHFFLQPSISCFEEGCIGRNPTKGIESLLSHPIPETASTQGCIGRNPTKGIEREPSPPPTHSPRPHTSQVAFTEIPQRELRAAWAFPRVSYPRNPCVMVAFTEIPKRELIDEYVQSFACLGSCLGCIPRNPRKEIES